MGTVTEKLQLDQSGIKEIADSNTCCPLAFLVSKVIYALVLEMLGSLVLEMTGASGFELVLEMLDSLVLEMTDGLVVELLNSLVLEMLGVVSLLVPCASHVAMGCCRIHASRTALITAQWRGVFGQYPINPPPCLHGWAC